jgi:hypothetical protein
MHYKSFKTNTQLPKFVRYWDGVFTGTSFWWEWQMMQSVVETCASELQCNSPFSKKEARGIAWNIYCAMVSGDERRFFFTDFCDFCESIPDAELPIFAMAQIIGLDIANGITETAAVEKFQKWLLDDPKNGVFGGYCMRSDFSIYKMNN